MQEQDTISIFIHRDTISGKSAVALKGRGRLRGLRHFTASEAREIAKQLNRVAASVSDDKVICT